jgi:hypothetical protein
MERHANNSKGAQFPYFSPKSAILAFFFIHVINVVSGTSSLHKPQDPEVVLYLIVIFLL